MQPPHAEITLCGASVRAAAASARRSGLGVQALDFFGDSDLRALCKSWHRLESMAQVSELLKRQRGARPVVLTGFSGDMSQWADAIGQHQPILGASAQQWQLTTDPQWIDIVSDAASDCVTVNRPQRLPASKPPLNRDAWLWKQSHRTGGLGVRWANAASTRQTSGAAAGWFEQWIPGRSYGIGFLASQGKPVQMLGIAASIRSRLAPRAFQYEGSIGPVAVPEAMQGTLQSLGSEIARQSGLRGLFGIDVIIDPEGQLWLLEINPRWCASMELYDTAEPSLMLRHVVACCGHPVDAWSRWQPPQAARGRRVIYAHRSGRFDWHRLVATSDANVRWADLPAAGAPIEAGQPICTAICQADDLHACARHLARIARADLVSN